MNQWLSKIDPFAQGRNQPYFIHSDNQNRCLKARRADFTFEDRRHKRRAFQQGSNI